MERAGCEPALRLDQSMRVVVSSGGKLDSNPAAVVVISRVIVVH